VGVLPDLVKVLTQARAPADAQVRLRVSVLGQEAKGSVDPAIGGAALDQGGVEVKDDTLDRLGRCVDEHAAAYPSHPSALHQNETATLNTA
jgi:hypothetical protein